MTTEHVSVPREDYVVLLNLARRSLHFAFVWNDHNFGDAKFMAKQQAGELGISSLDKANDFLDKSEAILSSATAISPRVVSDAIALIDRMKDQHANISTTCHVTTEQLDAVRSALESLPVVMVRDGWKLVPVEPTDGMKDAHKKVWASGVDAVWNVMLAAAPSPNDAKEEW